MNKAVLEWTLFDDDISKEKLEILNTLETMWDDERNERPDELNFFVEELPLGSKVRITFELLEQER